ncbi:prolyl oligopeptidase family protein [Psychrobium sp. 1_MG-2023]|uniref:prolyl oligopeptidase family serine peptidase n=1 Tax=Psychrobium sp. 1_MG-2023 TaxID=3062624 RepID=UPI000C33B25E|nr:prolyl oligopeptidase family serine peptidase [Psychrobium sp. 1_MG-2023]MDP2561267.1 prolyl oligopeptidase family serine peptidase [Psychrobium sp. 1_MG-2023]PKF55233.1 S9 family peptidase [Alteromonadales bacterium alter-6D02]
MNKKPLIVAALTTAVLAGCNSTPEKKIIQKADAEYQWLEEVEGKAALDWVNQQNEVAFAQLKSSTVYKESVKETLTLLNSNDRIAYATQYGDYLYNFWTDKDNQRGIYRRTTLEQYQTANPKWETILDVDALAKEDGQSWVYKGMNCLYPNYNRCLVKLSPGGTDAVVVREFDISKKAFVEGGFELAESKSDISWRDENSVFVGTDFGPGSMTDSGYPAIVKIWERGTPLSSAQKVYQSEKSSVAASGYSMRSGDTTVDVIYDATSFYSSKVFVLDNGKKVQLPIPKDAGLSAFLNDELFIKLKSPWTVNGQTFTQGSVIHAPLTAILKGNAQYKTLIASSDSLSISSIRTTKSALLVTVLDNVKSKVLRFTKSQGSWNSNPVNIDDKGSISVFNTNELSDDFFLNYTSFLKPSTLYKVDGNSGKLTQLKAQKSQFNSDDLVTEQFWATSKDGTKVPYFAIMKKDIDLNGKNPTLLYGYGGFEVSLKPSYSATLGKNWLEKGGVYILSNIRGGGEFGPRWHQAALKTNRHKAYEDFEAIAQDLIDRKITSPDHLGIQGGSNGGLLMGAAFTRRPDLYNAVVCQVPLLDMKRYTKLLAGASWAAEYGDPDKPEMWDYIKTYSPFHNLDAETDYPKVFFTTSTKDDRVHPAHARKMVAKMQDLGHDVYYFENMEGGHAGAADNTQKAEMYSLIYSYLWQQLN